MPKHGAKRPCPPEGVAERTRPVGEALSLPKLTQLGGSMNVERLRRSGRLRAAPTGAVETGGWRVACQSPPTVRKYTNENSPVGGTIV